MVTPASFRNTFKEFASSVTYTNASIQFWLDFATVMLVASRWGAALDMGLSLFIAHNLVLEAKAEAEAQAGGVPGTTTGPISAKSVDKVSINYDTQAGIVADAGHWNLSIYGTRFIKLSRMMGAGPLQINGRACDAGPLSSQNAWPGPDCMPGFTNFQ